MVKIDCNALQKEMLNEGVLLDRSTIMGMCAAINTNKNMMFAGVPGTAKTMSAKALAKTIFPNEFDEKFHRITASPGITRQEFFGDWNYQKQFLEIQASCGGKVCTADAVKNVYRKENFLPGAAVKAIKSEGILFIDEGNRGGEDFQNMVLEVAEEKQATIPMHDPPTIKSGTKGLPLSIITYNEHDIGTEPFSDAFKRRFMRIQFKSLPRSDSEKILEKKHGATFLPETDKIIRKVVE